MLSSYEGVRTFLNEISGEDDRSDVELTYVLTTYVRPVCCEKIRVPDGFRMFNLLCRGLAV